MPSHSTSWQERKHQTGRKASCLGHQNSKINHGNQWVTLHLSLQDLVCCPIPSYTILFFAHFPRVLLNIFFHFPNRPSVYLLSLPRTLPMVAPSNILGISSQKSWPLRVQVFCRSSQALLNQYPINPFYLLWSTEHVQKAPCLFTCLWLIPACWKVNSMGT